MRRPGTARPGANRRSSGNPSSWAGFVTDLPRAGPTQPLPGGGVGASWWFRVGVLHRSARLLPVAWGAQAAKRIALEIIGWTLVLAGIAALVLPGPGLLMMFGGMVVLSQRYEWAERRLEPIDGKALQTRSEARRAGTEGDST